MSPACLTSLRMFMPALLLCMSLSAECASARYRSASLEQLAKSAALDRQIAACHDSATLRQLKFKGSPLNVRTEDGVVTHIGLRLFSDEQTAAIANPAVCDFLERLALMESAMKPDELSRFKLVNSIEIPQGNIKSLPKIAADTTLTFRLTSQAPRNYSVQWSKGTDPVLKITFPASFRMLSGLQPNETLELLRGKMLSTKAAPRPYSAPAPDRLEPCDSTAGRYLILKGSQRVLPVITDNSYYAWGDSVPRLLYGPSYPVESLANLFVTGQIANRATAKVRMLQYGLTAAEFDTPLNSLVNALLDEGCHPYFAIKTLDRDTGTITAMVEMVNDALGYEHLLSIKLTDDSILRDSPGDIEITIAGYIPIQNIAELYYDKPTTNTPII